ncbi:hypothetical protein, partial [Candidatus Dormiibacter inghamiae]|uniref:hypothetical protein n=1 Tax=Candidatus Dormiibacter inghamiae TaxID=3127013 RepID=UPI0030C6E5EE
MTGSVPAETRTSQAFPRWTMLPRSRLFSMIGKLLVNIAVNMQPADSASGSIRLDEFGEYLGGRLPVMNLTGSAIDFASHHRQIVGIGG